MKKGKVVEIKDKYAIVLNEDMVYEKIKKKDNLDIGKNIYYFNEDKYIVKSIPFKKYFLVAALFLILFIPSLMNIDKTYGYISIDINPSIQLKVDKNLKTLDIEALNTDGKDILKQEWIGKDAKVVIENIIKETEEKGILNEDRDFVLLSYYLKDKDKTNEEKLIKDFDEIFNKEKRNYEVAVVKSDNKSFEKSKKENTTIGKATINQKIKKTTNDLMEVKQQIKKDKDVKVYKKQKNNIKDKNNEKQEIIKGNEKKKENIDLDDNGKKQGEVKKSNKVKDKSEIKKEEKINKNKEGLKSNNDKKDNGKSNLDKLKEKENKDEKIKENKIDKGKKVKDKLDEKQNNKNKDSKLENSKSKQSDKDHKSNQKEVENKSKGKGKENKK